MSVEGVGSASLELEVGTLVDKGHSGACRIRPLRQRIRHQLEAQLFHHVSGDMRQGGGTAVDADSVEDAVGVVV